MRKQLSTLLAVTLLIVASCKKNGSKNEEQNPTNCQLTESAFSSTGGDSEKTLFTYNNDGKVATVKYEGEDYQSTYTYSATQIVKTVKDGNDNETYVYILNNQGRITTETQAGNYRVDYTYNNDGYLTQSIRTNLGNGTTVTTTYTYTAGNLTKVVSPDFTLNITYTTDEAKANYFDDVDTDLPSFYNSVLKGYYGKTSKNLIAKITYDAGYYENYTYEKDANGNVTKVTMRTSDNSGYTLINKFTCK